MFGSGPVDGDVTVFVSTAQALEELSPTSVAVHVLQLEAFTPGFSSPLRQLIEPNTTALCGISKPARTVPSKACLGCLSDEKEQPNS